MDFKTLYALKKSATDCRRLGKDLATFMDLAQAKLGEGASFYDVSDAFYAYAECERLEVNRKKQQHKRVAGREYIVATQFFTPQGICEYLAENGLQSLCLGGVQDGRFLDVKSLAEGKIAPEKIKVLDPAVGTGNLLYAVACKLKSELESRGIENANKIIAANICGLDLDRTAAEFAKKRLEKLLGAEVNICTIEQIPAGSLKRCAKKLGAQLVKKLGTLGVGGSLVGFTASECEKIKNAAENGFVSKEQAVVAEILSRKYDFVIMNPPYLSSSDFGKDLDEFIKENYPCYRGDLFAAFMARGLELLERDGSLGVVAPYNWMFLKQFEPLRKHIIGNASIKNLVKMPCFGYMRAVVYLSAAVIKPCKENDLGSYIGLQTSDENAEVLATACKSDVHKYQRHTSEFAKYPSSAIAFWLSERAAENFGKGKLADFLEIRQGIATGNNKKYLKAFADVSQTEVDFTSKTLEEFIAGGKKYALYNKGGKFRKWFGNRDFVIDFSEEARKKLAESGNHLPSKNFYFNTGITWTLVSSKGVFGARLTESSLFDVGGSCGFPKNAEDLYVILAYLCSKVATFYLAALNPTVNTQVGDLKNLPYINPTNEQKAEIIAMAKECVGIAKDDWLEGEQGIEPDKKTKGKRRERVCLLEEKLNEIFIDIYGLQGELTPKIKSSDITLRR